MSFLKIENCYDSHVHWLATGDFAERLNLSDLKSPQDLLQMALPSGLPVVLGYGWNFSETLLKDCTRQLLDQWCSDRPVILSRADGHAVWANTLAFKKVDLFESSSFSEALLPRSSDQTPLGVAKEEARTPLLQSLPKPSHSTMTRQLMRAQQLFHHQGLTHIRDVHMKPSQWEVALHLESSGLLKLAVEAFAYEEGVSYQNLIAFVKEAQKSQQTHGLLQIKGVKVFVDGSLGSETAAISEPYSSGSGQGFLHLQKDEIKECLKDCWSSGIEVAFHCIGDRASRLVAESACEVQIEGHHGCVHFEHVQILSEHTISLMKNLKGVCHLQPGHWLDDKSWLKEKVGERLWSQSFPWRKLQEAEVPFFFGSDSPLSRPGIFRIQQAIEDATENGLSRLLGSFQSYISHPDKSWVPNTFSEFADGELKALVFKGETL